MEAYCLSCNLCFQVFARLVRLLDHMKVPEARAVVVWMVGEHSLGSTRVLQMLPIVLQYLAGSFIKEADETKLQILNCAAKVLSMSRLISSTCTCTCEEDDLIKEISVSNLI